MNSENEDNNSEIAPKAKEKSWPLLAILAVSALLNALAWAVIFWKLPPTEETVYLHYNIFFGIDLVGQWYELLWIPGSGLAAIILNTAVAFLAKHMENFYKYLGFVITLFIQIVILLASVLVVLLNS